MILEASLFLPMNSASVYRYRKDVILGIEVDYEGEVCLAEILAVGFAAVLRGRSIRVSDLHPGAVGAV